jgi:hypothetical protein
MPIARVLDKLHNKSRCANSLRAYHSRRTCSERRCGHAKTWSRLIRRRGHVRVIFHSDNATTTKLTGMVKTIRCRCGLAFLDGVHARYKWVVVDGGRTCTTHAHHQ